MFIVNFAAGYAITFFVIFGWTDYKTGLNPLERWKG